MKLILFMVTSFSLLGQINTSMKKIGAELSNNLDYIYSKKKYLDKSNKQKILKFISNLEKEFKRSEKHFKARKNGQYFSYSIMREQLKEIRYHFESNNKNYSHRLMTQLPGVCIACHMNDKISARIFSNLPIEKKFTDTEKAIYFQSTRQYDESFDYYMNYFKDKENIKRPLNLDQIVENFLLMLVARNKFSKNELSELMDIDFSKKFPSVLRTKWKSSLNKIQELSSQKLYSKDKLTISEVRKLIDKNKDFFQKDYVLKAFNEEKIEHYFLKRSLQIALSDSQNTAHRNEILYYLGKTELILEADSLFPIGSLYLKSCLNNKSKKFKERCYELYRNYLITMFTGSRGTDLPHDIKAELKKYKPVLNQ